MPDRTLHHQHPHRHTLRRTRQLSRSPRVRATAPAILQSLRQAKPFVAGATAAHFGTTTFQALEPITTPDKGTVRLPPVQAHPQKSATEPATASLAAAA